MSEETQDERVRVAVRNWAARFIANGVDYSDFTETIRRIQRWDDWLPEWSKTALYYEGLATAADRGGGTRSAAEAWRRAAMCWHFGKFVSVEDSEASAHAQRRVAECFSRGLGSLEPAGERVEVPYGNAVMPGILRRPVGVQRPPIVVMWPGLDSTKEELQPTADYLLRRGLAILAVDGPGQGETEAELRIEAASEAPVGAAIDFARTLEGIASDRVAVTGISLGGYYAIRAAAFDSRIIAAVDLAGPYCFGTHFDELPPMSRAAFQVRSGSKNLVEARQRANMLDLQDVASRVGCALLVVHGTADPLIPFADAERIAKEAPRAQLARFEGGNHGLTNRAFEMRSLVGDWLAEQLR